MNPRTWQPAPLDATSGLAVSRARVLTGTSGAITTAGTITTGLTVTKTANKTGRYTVQAVDTAGSSVALYGVKDIQVAIFSPTADAAITTGKATQWIIRSLTETSGLFYIQFFTQSATIVDTTITVTNTDAELENSSIFTVTVVSQRDQVTP